MGLKKRSKVSAEFSMSSLTDIIFLLLIFFMLTSTLAKIQPFDIPKSDAKTVASTNIVVEVRRSGDYTVQGREVRQRILENVLTQEVKKLGRSNDPTITVVAETGTPFDRVVDIMKIAGRLQTKAIIATQARN